MKQLMIKLSLVVSILSGLLFMPMASAAALDCTSSDLTSKQQIQCGACQAAGTPANCTPAEASGSLTDTIKTVINILSLVAGAVAVVMVIVGGFRYITSAGNPEATKSARNTILYAIVGLIIIATAQIIVHFVLNSVTNDCVNGKTPSGQKCS